jgi:hypothetical protein
MSGQCKNCGYDGCVCDDKELQRELTYVTKQLTKAHENIGIMIDQIGMLQLKDTATINQLDNALKMAGSNRNHAHKLSIQLATITEQRDEARRLAEKYRNLSCDSQEEADETILPWETTNPNEL